MRRNFFLIVLLAIIWVGCADDDSFTVSTANHLTFSVDTVKTDTVFANIGSSTFTFWVFNHSGDGLRLKSVRLRQGNQTGFRVNVDGCYLDNSLGAVVTDLEVRDGDSIRVFVELTPQETHQDSPQLVEDDLVFNLESGMEQRVRLQGYSWDALLLKSGLKISCDTVIESAKPIVIFGEGISVDSGAVLTVRNTTLYFHDGAGLTVGGTLRSENCVMRGDRLDRMFPYLPYDRVSGQWRGVRFTPSSTDNWLLDTEIRNAYTGISLEGPTIYDPSEQRLTMVRCVVHNHKGYGVISFNSNIGLYYCQLSNTLDDCLALFGGICEMDHCTLAQFYPFSADRGVALRFADSQDGEVVFPVFLLICSNTLVTGYEADVVMGERKDESNEDAVYGYEFSDCLLRTPVVEGDTVNFRNIVWETPDDSIQGKRHFRTIDEENLYYDFHLDSLSTAKGMGCYENG